MERKKTTLQICVVNVTGFCFSEREDIVEAALRAWDIAQDVSDNHEEGEEGIGIFTFCGGRWRRGTIFFYTYSS